LAHDFGDRLRAPKIPDLEDAGHRVILQQWDFANRNFMERMDAALASGARVVAILTPQYLATDYCTAEWMHALHGDPLNKKVRLIVLRCAECQPRGLLTTIAYWDLVPVCGQDDLLVEIVSTAVMPDADRRHAGAAGAHWREARPLIHDAIRPIASFTGRENELQKIESALWPANADAVSIDQPVVLTGLGGTGKSTLARQYTWRTQDRYVGIWWLNAERPKNAESWEGIEHGLVALGDHYIAGLAQAKDRAKAAQLTLDFLAQGGFSKPWLLIFDNVNDPRVLSQWRPRGNVKTLITSRLGGWGRGAAPVEIKEWPTADAVKYLLAKADRADLSEDQARAVAEELGCLPLALSHAAAYLRDNTSASAKSYLDAITVHMRTERGVRTSPDDSFTTKNPLLRNESDRRGWDSNSR
jgi:TIR domain/AAA ATPase domain